MNVGANFAHVSPRMDYNKFTEANRYCSALELAAELMHYYIVQTVKQSYSECYVYM